MRSFLFKTVITLFVLALAVGVAFYFLNLNKTDLPPKEYIIKVEEFDNAYTVSKKLKEKGVIKYSTPFYISYIIFGKGTSVNPGGYKVSTDMTSKQIIYVLEEKPWAKYVEIPANISKEKIGQMLGDVLDWDTLDKQYFAYTMAGMQWQSYEDKLEEIFSEEYKWTNTKTNTFMTLSSLYYDDQYDIFKDMYIPATYEIPLDSSRAQVAGILVDQYNTKHKDADNVLTTLLNKKAMDNVANLIEEEMVLLPDIVAIPPRDVTLKKEGNKTYVLFTASYWNKGRGPLELIADPNTKGNVGDFDRKIFQRIYSLDGSYTERLSGKFLWHAEHLHYHFQDFAVYYFDPVDSIDVDGSISASGVPKDKLSFKSTFCIRDSEPIDLAHPGANKDPDYKVCGKERQGISPGWADSYYYNYIDQRFDITSFPSGVYRLKIVINPKDRFDEVTLDNNTGEVLLSIDKEKNTVEVLEEKQYGI